jgi:hypothetical protein
MFYNDKYKIDNLLNLKENIEMFDIVNIQVLHILLNMNVVVVVVEKINKEKKNEEIRSLDQIMVENNLIKDLAR